METECGGLILPMVEQNFLFTAIGIEGHARSSRQRDWGGKGQFSAPIYRTVGVRPGLNQTFASPDILLNPLAFEFVSISSLAKSLCRSRDPSKPPRRGLDSLEQSATRFSWVTNGIGSRFSERGTRLEAT